MEDTELVEETTEAATSALRPVLALDVTDGAVTGTRGRFHVEEDSMRAIAVANGSPLNASTVALTATYRGETETSSPLGSGEIRRQFGLKLLHRDPCNLLYAMVRVVNGRGRLVVQTKLNPGESTSRQCGNDGYADVGSVDVGPVGINERHTLRASWDATRRVMTFKFDQRPPFSVTLDRATVAAIGRGFGVRSDNAVWDFTLAYAP